MAGIFNFRRFDIIKPLSVLILFIFMWYIIAAITVIIGWFVYTYNRLVTLRVRSKEALSDIDVQTKRRYDLIPNLVETVKGYITHERNVLENVTKARAEAMQTKGTAFDREKQENALSATLKTLFAVAENYPDLKANANFLDLQRELADTENKIQAARRFYNGNVRDLNTKIEVFPARIVANTFRFEKMKFFEVASEAEREPVKVKF
jgi:LemA protein